jgi:hypothetical protein
MTHHKDCPECGAYKIRQSVSLCDVCEVSQRYEKRIAELQALLDLAAAHAAVAADDLRASEASASRGWQMADELHLTVRDLRQRAACVGAADSGRAPCADSGHVAREGES